MDASTLIALAIAVAAAAGIGAWTAARVIGRRVRRITETVVRLGEPGSTVAAERGGGREVSALADAVNATAERLRGDVEASRGEQRVRDLILSSMKEGVLLVAEDGSIPFLNRAMDAHLHSRPRTAAALLPLELREAVDRVREGGDAVTVEVETGSPSRWLRGSAAPVAGAHSVILVVSDVTDAKRLEAVRRDFVVNASHELKTPAATIQATAETIVRAADDDPAVVPRFAEQLEREANRLSRIVADLLDLSRLEAGSELGELVRLDGLVREEAGRFREQAERSGVELAVDAPSVPAVSGSGRDLALLIRNLVDNAIRYTREGGRVNVAVVPGPDGCVELTVADTGPGIPSRDLSRVFERFYRVDQARSRETGGTGLGLSIVRHVTENHGGTVSVQSELGRGTRFEVRLPGASMDDQAPQR